MSNGCILVDGDAKGETGIPVGGRSDQALRISSPITDTSGVAVRTMRKRVKEL